MQKKYYAQIAYNVVDTNSLPTRVKLSGFCDVKKPFKPSYVLSESCLPLLGNCTL